MQSNFVRSPDGKLVSSAVDFGTTDQRRTSAVFGYLRRNATALVVTLSGLIFVAGCATDGRIPVPRALQVEDFSALADASRSSSPVLPAHAPATEPSLRSLATGTVTESVRLNGKGQLSVANATGKDAVAKLVDPVRKTRIAVFYVRGNSDHTLPGIPDGTYKLIFAMGRGWNSRTQTFQQEPSFSMFEDDFVFTTTSERRSDGIYQSNCRFSVTLHPVADGNATTEPISHEYFSQF